MRPDPSEHVSPANFYITIRVAYPSSAKAHAAYLPTLSILASNTIISRLHRLSNQ